MLLTERERCVLLPHIAEGVERGGEADVVRERRCALAPAAAVVQQLVELPLDCGVRGCRHLHTVGETVGDTVRETQWERQWERR